MHYHYLACDCNVEGSNNTSCDSEGKCACNDNIYGDKCDKCKAGSFPFPICNNGKHYNNHKSTFNVTKSLQTFLDCNCNVNGSTLSCDSNGICSCLGNFVGDKCTKCDTGSFGVDCEGTRYLLV